MPRGVLIVPIGAVGPDELLVIRRILAGELGWLGLDVRVQVARENPPLVAYDWDRRQYRAALVNRWLEEKYRHTRQHGYLVVGVCGCDAYVPGLNFVFGLAEPGIGVASVYTARLSDNVGETVYLERLGKEVLHEIGHLLGLGHCSSPGCVMRFSNSVREVDEKEASFCPVCRKRLAELYGLDVDDKS